MEHTDTASATDETTTTPEVGNEGATPVPAEKTAEKFELEHLKIIKEDEINVKDLPADIKGKMSALKMLVSKYGKQPTANLLATIKKQDIVIADLIQTWQEKEAEKKRQASPAGLAEAKEKADAEAKVKADAEAKILADAEAKKKTDADAEAKRKTEEEENNKPDVKMEKAVREKMVDGKISTADLKAILGRDPSTWNGKEKIGTLTVSKVWLQEVWESK